MNDEIISSRDTSDAVAAAAVRVRWPTVGRVVYTLLFVRSHVTAPVGYGRVINPTVDSVVEIVGTSASVEYDIDILRRTTDETIKGKQ